MTPVKVPTSSTLLFRSKKNAYITSMSIADSQEMEDKGREYSRRYPELDRFASREEAKKALNAWQKQLMKTPKFWLVLVGYTCGVGLTVGVILVSLRHWFLLPKSMFGGLVGGITGGSGAVLVTWFWRHQCRRFLRQELVARGIPICVKCGYDLQGQAEPRCSECGTPFDAKLITAGRINDGSGSR